MSSMVPPSTSTVTVYAIKAGKITFLPASLFFEPVLPGYEGLSGPIYTFLIEHLTKGKIMFDLGMRRDQEKYAPAVQGFFDLFREMGGYDMGADDGETVSEQLVKGGVELDSVNAVIWSHTHFDHIGDISTFPSTTELVVGPGTDLQTYPEHEDAHLIESDTAGHRVTELSFSNTMLHIADLPAMDYFGDGSFYVLNTPGHHPGHISSLARVTPTMFVVLGGDCCHHIGDICPTLLHHSICPCPASLLQSMTQSLCKSHFPEIVSEPLLKIPPPPAPSVYRDYEATIQSLKRLARLDADPDVLMIIAHDGTASSVVEEFPGTINEWKEKGWKNKLMWRFLEKDGGGWRFG
ncbi:beta-lactamase-like protein [Armillaria novae-zelandiae]|uniref:Beta-lactamase-like protein n=1 Tax=Armillaria novae-zelandiae TaxID=153914 RepID=A0AA39NMU5_9AGAR|nr:beta-lactamase-like protein [Armillaria novae-zelandiae]